MKKKKVIQTFEEPYVVYGGNRQEAFSFPVHFKVIDQLAASRKSSVLLDLLLKKSGLSQKALAEYVFELTPKTLSTYHRPGKEFNSQSVEIIIKLIDLYENAIEVFGSAAAFNRWAERPNPVLFGRSPISFFCTVTGIELVFEEVMRIAEGMSA
jgi:uncharacterized protein (DUF2384 family)